MSSNAAFALRLALVALFLSLAHAPAARAATQNPTESTCHSLRDPYPPGIPALSGPGSGQRAAFLADDGKLVAIGGSYYAVWVPPAFYTAAKRILIFDLHGTGGYAEVEHGVWRGQFAALGYAFVEPSWGGDTPAAESGASLSEVSGHRMFLARYLYDEIGPATWFICAGRVFADRSSSDRLDV